MNHLQNMIQTNLLTSLYRDGHKDKQRSNFDTTFSNAVTNKNFSSTICKGQICLQFITNTLTDSTCYKLKIVLLLNMQ